MVCVQCDENIHMCCREVATLPKHYKSRFFHWVREDRDNYYPCHVCITRSCTGRIGGDWTFDP